MSTKYPATLMRTPHMHKRFVLHNINQGLLKRPGAAHKVYVAQTVPPA